MCEISELSELSELSLARFLSCQKLLNQEDAWASPGYAVNPALRRRALAGRTRAADRRNPSI